MEGIENGHRGISAKAIHYDLTDDLMRIRKESSQETNSKDKRRVSFMAVIIVVLIAILAIIGSSAIGGMISDKQMREVTDGQLNPEPQVVSDPGSYITLDDFTSAVKITSGGEYHVNGSSSFGIVVDTSEDVALILENVDITANNTNAIESLQPNVLKIVVPDGTRSTLTTNGVSDKDSGSCISANGKLEISGTGEIEITNTQNGRSAISSELDMSIGETSISVNSVDAGISSNGSISIKDSGVKVISVTNGIFANNSLTIDGGKVNISSATYPYSATSYSIQNSTLAASGWFGENDLHNTGDQVVLNFVLDEPAEAGTVISVSSNDKHVAFIPMNETKKFTISAPEFERGATYKVTTGDSTTSADNFVGIYTDGELTSPSQVTISGASEFVSSSEEYTNLFGTNPTADEISKYLQPEPSGKTE